MPTQTLIKRSEYHDSVSLMLVARQLSQFPGVTDAAVMMGAEANKGLLQESGLLTAEAQTASPNDLIIAIRGEPPAIAAALVEAERLLAQKQTAEGASGEFRPKTLRGAVKSNPAANVAIISVAGRYAAAEAWDALRSGLHVLLFSDNVSLEDEIALKHYAVEHGLLLMGPGAGTAILNGVALGFANALPRGPVGIASAAGTGLQEVSTLLAKQGVGVSQGIGVGGRDLKAEVGGLMMLAGLQALQDDPATSAIVLISKPPAEAIAQKMLAQVATSEKPTVVCFLGQIAHDEGKGDRGQGGSVRFARTLEEAALMVVQLPALSLSKGSTFNVQRSAIASAQSKGYIRALFSGGTLCYEAQVIWRELLAAPVLSNAPLEKANQLANSLHSQGHTAIDLGEEEFTVGRPHPMIDNDLRIRRLLQEASDPQTAVIMLDVVIGYGAHPDPASELAPAIRQAKEIARAAGRELPIIASVTGTEQDPQGLTRQTRALEAAGVVVCESNAAAARVTAEEIG